MLEPFLLRHATPRSAAAPFDGSYCDEQKMWVINVGNDLIPVIDHQAEAQALATKTAVQREQDDEMSASPILDLQTKTKAELESEDQKSPILVASLLTKTDADRESDDDRSMLV